MKTPRLLALALAAALALPSHAPAQARQQGPIFGTGIEIINLSLSVTDARNNFVTDLAQRDFAVFEDGIRQDLSLFTHENLPISMVLMIDTSASMEEKLKTAQDAAIRFTKTLRPQDLAQVVQFNERATPLQTFTNDHGALEKAIRSTEASGPTALHNALYVSLKDLTRDKKAAELRRRAIVMLSDGEDTASLVTDDQVLDLAKKSEINIYTISLRPARAQDRARAAFSQAEYLFNALTRETGGRAYFPSSLSELDSVYDRIAEELRTLYSVGYISSNLRRDGKWRRIVVRVPEREGVQIRHKLGYYAPPDRGSEPEEEPDPEARAVDRRRRRVVAGPVAVVVGLRVGRVVRRRCVEGAAVWAVVAVRTSVIAVSVTSVVAVPVPVPVIAVPVAARVAPAAIAL
jgi:VWFA-related protein